MTICPTCHRTVSTKNYIVALDPRLAFVVLNDNVWSHIMTFL